MNGISLPSEFLFSHARRFRLGNTYQTARLGATLKAHERLLLEDVNFPRRKQIPSICASGFDIRNFIVPSRFDEEWEPAGGLVNRDYETFLFSARTQSFLQHRLGNHLSGQPRSNKGH